MKDQSLGLLSLVMTRSSIGWCWGAERPEGYVLEDGGVMVYGDGRSPQGRAFAEERRACRSRRRMLRRKRQSRRALLREFEARGWLPNTSIARAQLFAMDPYAARSRAAEVPVDSGVLARALWHVAKRTGWAAWDGQDAQNNVSPVRQALAALEAAKGDLTVGQYLHQRQAKARMDNPAQRQPGIRFRPRYEKNSAIWDEMASREMMIQEFERIRLVQGDHQGLDEKGWSRLRALVFPAPSSPPVEGPICAIYAGPEAGRGAEWPQEPAGVLGLPSIQCMRVRESVGALEVLGEADQNLRPLNPEQTSAAYGVLLQRRNISLPKLSALVGLNAGERLVLHGRAEGNMEGHQSLPVLAEIIGEEFTAWPLDEQDRLVEDLLSGAVGKAGHVYAGQALAPEVMTRLEGARSLIPDHTFRFSGRAARELLALMMEGRRLPEAMREAGFLGDPETKGGHLPYYACVLPFSTAASHGGSAIDRRFGRIADPSFHIGLGQLRRLMEDLIRRKGKPAKMIVHLADELFESERGRGQNRKSRKEAARRRQEAGGEPDQGGYPRQLVAKMWEDFTAAGVQARCAYSLRPLTWSEIETGRAGLDLVLPFRRFLDDSTANMVFAFKDAMVSKHALTPWEAFGEREPPGWHEAEFGRYEYGIVKSMAGAYKAALEQRFDNKAHEKEIAGCLDLRLFRDQRGKAQCVQSYLSMIAPNVDLWPGLLTGRLRKDWGLSDILSRKAHPHDLRHVMVDAALIGLAASIGGKGLEGLICEEPGQRPTIAKPENLGPILTQLRELLADIVVYHRPQHSVHGRLFDETIYGVLVDERAGIDRRTAREKERAEEEGVFNLLYRKRSCDLTARDIRQIRDEGLRDTLQNAALSASDAPREMLNKEGVRHVRVLKRDRSAMIINKTQKRRGVSARIPSELHHMALWRLPDGQHVFCGVAHAELRLDHNGRKPHPAARKVMMLHKGDVVRFETQEKTITARVMSLRPSTQQIGLTPHYEGGSIAARQTEEGVLMLLRANVALEKNLRRIKVHPAGL